MGVASPGLNGLAAPVWGTVDQPSEFVLFQPVPFFLNSPGELIQVVCSWLSGVDGPLEHIPGVLYHVHVQGDHFCRPFFSDGVVDLFVCCDDSGTVAGGIIVNKDEILFWVGLLKGLDDVTQNFIPVLDGVHIALNDVQGNLVVVGESRPHHD